jgi:hypothetical protein
MKKYIKKKFNKKPISFFLIIVYDDKDLKLLIADNQITTRQKGKANGAPPADTAGSSGFDSHPGIF